MGIPWDGTGINCYGMGMGQINVPWTTLNIPDFITVKYLFNKSAFKETNTENLPTPCSHVLANHLHCRILHQRCLLTCIPQNKTSNFLITIFITQPVVCGGHCYWVCAVSDITLRRHIHVSYPTFWQSLLTQLRVIVLTLSYEHKHS